jgi:acetylornithine deacetylase
MICDKASCAGYLELLPGDELIGFQVRFQKELLAKLFGKGEDTRDILVCFTEAYSGHRCDPDSSFGKCARLVAPGPLSAFNSGCEAGLRAGLHNTPTLVWGPGSLAQAHAVDEYVEWSQVEAGAHLFAEFALKWCS